MRISDTVDIEAYTLYSGSSGNSVYIRAGGDAILIDGGKTHAALCRAVASVGGELSRVRAVFVTHEHRDHISALDVTARKYRIPVHITEDSLYAAPFPGLAVSAVAHPPLFSERVGTMTVRSFLSSHDSAMSVGYTVEFDGENVKLGILTDTGCVTEAMENALSSCTHVILESNHDVDMLTHGSYPFFLKERILSKTGHLSNDDASAFAVRLQRRGTRTFVLFHLSRENNSPDIAYFTASEALSETGLPFSLTTAPPDAPRRVI